MAQPPVQQQIQQLWQQQFDMMQPTRIITIGGKEHIAVYLTQQGWQNQQKVMANLQMAEMAAEQGDAHKCKEILSVEHMSNNLFLREQTSNPSQQQQRGRPQTSNSSTAAGSDNKTQGAKQSSPETSQSSKQ